MTKTPKRLGRRDFLLKSITLSAVTAAMAPRFARSEPGHAARIPLGLDAHSMRSMKWKATKLIEFAAEQRLDAVLLNNLDYFESLEQNHIEQLKQLADKHALRIYVGAGGICKNASKFSDKYGDAESMVAKGIRVAKLLGSPTVNVKIGSIDDRFLDGGIQPRIDEAVRVLKACKNKADDAGIKFAFENHAADLRSEELLDLIKEVGTETCGVMIDPGNSLWAMEDPMKQLGMLAPYVLCNSLRDYMIWESAEGATFQWTAIGEGLMDVRRYVEQLSQANPGMPVFVEAISNSARPIPFLRAEHWKAYPHLRAADTIDFLTLCRRGHAIDIDTPAEGVDAKTFEQEHQRNEFLRSIEYLRRECGAGQKT